MSAETHQPPTTLEVALELLAAGIVPIPLANDTKKRPALAWKVFQSERPTEDEVRLWFDREHRIKNHARGLAYTGLGLVTGQVSGDLVMVECEGRGREDFLGLAELARNSGLGELWAAFVGSWAEASPSGGLHWFIRLDMSTAPPGTRLPGNTKLARRPAPTETDPHGVDVLAETRGEAGYVVTYPTPGQFHSSGKGWTRVWGSPATIATLTWEQYQALCTLIGTLDEMPERAVQEFAPGQEMAAPSAAEHFLTGPTTVDASAGELTPGDDFERQTPWEAILVGWVRIKLLSNGYGEWIRPGKDPREGVSATTGHAQDRDRLYVFSTSAGLPTEVPLTKFYVYALLNFDGDSSAAAAELRRQGFGTDRPLRKAATPERNAELAEAARARRLQLLQGGQAAPAAPGRPEGGALPGPDHLGPEGLAQAVAAHPSARLVTPKKHNTDLTDSGNAEKLAAAHGHRLRYVVERGQWLVWNSPEAPGRWLPDPAGTVVLELMRTTLLELEVGSADEREHRAHSLSRRGLQDAVTVARGLPGIVVSTRLLDADPYALGTPSGVVDLRTGILAPADPDALITRATLVVPDASCPTPLWDAFLGRMFGGDPVLIGYVQRLMGYALSGLVSWHVLPFLYGPGANGKSVLAGVLRRLMGTYASAAPAGFLMAGLQQHSTELAMLQGLRFLVASEIDQRAKFDESKVKLLTGGDAITARHMRQDFHTFDPTHKLWLLGNHLPRVAEGGESFWRRLRLVNCGAVVPPEERIPDLDALMVSSEGAGILAWAIAGFQDLMARGSLEEPLSVMASTNEYAAEESGFETFVEECLVVGHGRVPVTQLRAAYTEWCQVEGMEPLTNVQLGRELARLGIRKVSPHGQKHYDGVSLASPEVSTWVPR